MKKRVYLFKAKTSMLILDCLCAVLCNGNFKAYRKRSRHIYNILKVTK